jgi:hypothetical protein
VLLFATFLDSGGVVVFGEGYDLGDRRRRFAKPGVFYVQVEVLHRQSSV